MKEDTELFWYVFIYLKKKSVGVEKSRDLHKMIIHNPAPIKRDLLTAREIHFFILTPRVQAAALRLEHISHQPA